MQNKQNVSIIGLGHIGLPMMTILSNLRKNGKYLYNVNVIEKNNRLCLLSAIIFERENLEIIYGNC